MIRSKFGVLVEDKAMVDFLNDELPSVTEIIRHFELRDVNTDNKTGIHTGRLPNGKIVWFSIAERKCGYLNDKQNANVFGMGAKGNKNSTTYANEVDTYFDDYFGGAIGV